uniref:Secreted protein n=1 Tax=Achlya hypogyna TaxID=1202772 RepID=A0A0A7CNJ3_ACHHY|nr:secreted protein [Achlya hypogyna]
MCILGFRSLCIKALVACSLSKDDAIDVAAPATPVPHKIQKLLTKYAAIFPDQLPDGLPPSRVVDFAFRLSRGKQHALDKFVTNLLSKGYVNFQTEAPHIPLPSIKELFDSMHGAKMDLASGYNQILVMPKSRSYTAFRTHNETYQWCVAPQGMAGMPGTWSRLMRILFGRFPFVVYLDDICVF